MRDLNIIRSKKGFISDMDGVIYHGSTLLPGVKEFVAWLQKEKKQFLFLTNSSERSPLELRKKLQAMGLDIEDLEYGYRIDGPLLHQRPGHGPFPEDPGPRLLRLHHRGPWADERPV